MDSALQYAKPNLAKSQRPIPQPKSMFRTHCKKKEVLAKTEKKKTIRIVHDVPPPPVIESDSMAVRFFNHHPEANVDPRPLEEKIQDIDNLFNESQIDDRNLFELLVQKVIMCELHYGEKSIEAIIGYIQLGAFYNKIEKYGSAYRHLKDAYELSEFANLDPHDRLFLAVEYVQTLFELGFDGNEMNENFLNLAETALFPYKNITDSTLDILYRRDLYIAQLKMCRRKFAKSLKFYQRAINLYHQKKNGQLQSNDQINNCFELNEGVDGELGALNLNAGLAARELKDKTTARSYFLTARSIFESLELSNKVSEVDTYISSLVEKPKSDDE
ncbi:hypothetical protein TRFO_38563 [Tritrichomonas foetus]|uniref:TPR Domain containing protein n=1 Tax=Tritrichomonas foetus TaxID=1144522 RepID=A0A1J4J866_9EUKA|nr:hypothetical protein TRFO_38563 [Tritrichomonas foetus]|eukprot:OHS95328.1 hypothetical protein TRFO_38563 [Tritrichomonas foetus]